jgi:protein-S-isoprenylcysteine O-methyltransferase Ste14
MMSGFGWAALALLFGYLALFFWGSSIAAQAAGKPVWLFARATGRDRLAAFGFRAAFVLAFFGPLLWLALPVLHKADPFWTEGDAPVLGIIGIFIAGLGAMVAFAAQISMGTSWRVGVVSGATGDLVSGGLYQFSRNPTFVGQCTLLAGVALAVPSVPTILAPILFVWSATTQVRSEETALRQALGSGYDRYAAVVPRWIGLRRREPDLDRP